MLELKEIIMMLLPEIVIGVALFFFKRSQNKRDAEAQRYREAKRKQDLLSMEMQMANNKLSFAVAMAIKRGTPNGEVEEGIEAYEAAKAKYMHFLNEQAAEHLNQ